MDFLNNSFAQIRDLFQSMTPGARITTALLLAVVGISLGYLVKYQVSGSDTYLMSGEIFSPRDLQAMDGVFAQAGLEGYEIEGGRIRVPRGQQYAFMGALADAGVLPHNFGDVLQKAMDDGSAFESEARRRERIKLAMQRELSLTISKMSGIDTADVYYGGEKAGGFRGGMVHTASVNVHPTGSLPLDPSQALSIRNLVAAAVAGLKTEDVIVTDLSNSRSFRGTSDDGIAGPEEDAFLAHKQYHEKQFKSKITEILGYVPGAIVTCNVELDREKINRKEQVEHDSTPVPYHIAKNTTKRTQTGPASGGPVGYRSQSANANIPMSISGASGTSQDETITDSQEASAIASTRTNTEQAPFPIQRVTASIALPESYFKRLWEDEHPAEPDADGNLQPQTPDPAELEQIRTLKVADIRKCVAGIFPQPVGGVIDPADLVEVSVFAELPREALPEPGMANAAVDWFARSWSTVGMIGLVLFSLLMLRSMIRSAPAPAFERMPASELAMASESAEAESESESGAPDEPRRFNTSSTSLKDELSELVAGDPDTAANVLRNWIASSP